MSEDSERYETDGRDETVTVNVVKNRDITFALEHPYEYVEQLRMSQSEACDVCGHRLSIHTPSMGICRDCDCMGNNPGTMPDSSDALDVGSAALDTSSDLASTALQKELSERLRVALDANDPKGKRIVWPRLTSLT